MIFEHQKHAINRLKLNYEASKLNSGLRSRLHTLLLGPSGSGKSHIARQVNSEVFYTHSTAWVIIGARDTPTVRHLFRYIVETENPVIILDEIDKIWGEDSWTRYVRAELFSLLDGRWPAGVFMEEEESDIQTANKNLQNAFFIGVGAFQSTTMKTTAGFHGHTETVERADLQKHLPTELINRFGDILTIEAPALNDVIRQCKANFPGLVVEVDIASKQIEKNETMGVRYMEAINAQILRNRVLSTQVSAEVEYPEDSEELDNEILEILAEFDDRE